MTRQTQNTIIGGVAALVVLIGLFAVVRSLGGGSDTAAGGSVGDAQTVADTASAPGAEFSVVTPPSDPSATVAVDLATDDATTTTMATTTIATTTTVATTAEPTTTTTIATTEVPSSSDTTAGGDGATTTSDPNGDGSDTTAGSDTTTSSDTAPSDSSTTVAPTPAPTGALTGLEREIVRLTNELRTNPTGPLRRVKETTAATCGEFHNVQVENGTHKAVPPLTLDETVSIHLAREWSHQMSLAAKMTHRPHESAQAKYAELGVGYRATGENVAWASGYPESSIATTFFEGWRESDGHYCSMVSPTFTHFGVGHVRAANGSDWGTQNFYSQG